MKENTIEINQIYLLNSLGMTYRNAIKLQPMQSTVMNLSKMTNEQNFLFSDIITLHIASINQMTVLK